MSLPPFSPPPVTPRLAFGENVSVATSGTGTDYAAFSDKGGCQLTIVNDTGTDLEWRNVGGTVALAVKDGTAFTIFGIKSASDVEVRRKDTSATPVTVKARIEG